MDNLPKHIGIIMDGNRRWAKKRGLSPLEGHRAGLDALEEIVKETSRQKIAFLTIYALSTENLQSREKIEIAGLFSLLKEGFVKKLPELKKANVRVEFVGNISRLPFAVRQAVKTSKKVLESSTGLQLNIALNYGSREEIVQTARQFPKDGSEQDFAKYLYTGSIPDPDLIIRTGGQMRLSNFLLWQAAYSELYFTETLWPDFDEKELEKALIDFQKRKRNFGV